MVHVPPHLRRWLASGALAATVLAAGGLPALAASAPAPGAPRPTESAAAGHQARRAQHLRQLAAHLDGYLGLTSEQVAGLVSQFGPVRLLAAAPLAKLSGRSVPDVIALKTADRGWRDVAASLGLSREQVRDETKRMHAALREARRQAGFGRFAAALAGYLDAPAGEVEQTVRQHGARAALAAAPLAKLGGRTLSDVIALKAADGGWKQVAEQLGLSPEQVRAEIRRLHAEMKRLHGEMKRLRAR